MTKEEFKELLRREIYSTCVSINDTHKIMESLDISSYVNDYVENPKEDYQTDMDSLYESSVRERLILDILFDILENADDYDYEKMSEEDYRENYKIKQELYFRDFKKTK